MRPNEPSDPIVKDTVCVSTSAKQQAPFAFSEFLAAFVMGIFTFTLIPVGLAWFLRDLDRIVPPAIYGTWFLFLNAVLIGVRTTTAIELRKKWLRKELNDEIGFSFAVMTVYILMFGLFCQALNSHSQVHFIVQPAGDPSVLCWIVFGAKSILSSLSFGLLDITGLIHVSVQASSLLAWALLLVFTLSIDYLLLLSAVRLYRFVQTRRKGVGNDPHQ